METDRRISAAAATWNDRRQFLQTCGAAAGAVLLGDLPGWGAPPAKETGPVKSSHLVRFGRTDLYVSRLCQGTAFRKVTRRADDPDAQKILHRCLDVGVNFFDSSEAYGWGGSEGALGKAIHGRRDQVVICTKAAPSHPPERDATPDKYKLGSKVALTRKVLFRKAEGSLKRLGTDYIDLYLVHHPDEITPCEEIADSMDALVKAGKIRYWGCSNFSAAQVAEFFELGKRQGKAPIAGTEDYYNIVGRDRLEPNLLALFRRTGLPLLAFSPQDAGRLSPGRPVKSGSTLAAVLDALDRVAKQLKATRPQVCIAWVLSHPEVTCVLAGAESPEHVSENFPGTKLVLPPEALAILNAASDDYRKQQQQIKEKAKRP